MVLQSSLMHDKHLNRAEERPPECVCFPAPQDGNVCGGESLLRSLVKRRIRPELGGSLSQHDQGLYK